MSLRTNLCIRNPTRPMRYDLPPVISYLMKRWVHRAVRNSTVDELYYKYFGMCAFFLSYYKSKNNVGIGSYKYQYAFLPSQKRICVRLVKLGKIVNCLATQIMASPMFKDIVFVNRLSGLVVRILRCCGRNIVVSLTQHFSLIFSNRRLQY